MFESLGIRDHRVSNDPMKSILGWDITDNLKVTLSDLFQSNMDTIIGLQ